MKALLLAAGVGTRLRPLTDQLPKCMVPVAGKPVLQWNIEFLRSQGVVDLVVNLHHYPKTVTGYFGDGKTFGVRLSYSYEPRMLGTAGALWAARRFFAAERFWLVYADNLINCSFERMERLHRTRGATLTMGLFWREDVSASGVAEFDGDGRITKFKEKPIDAEAGSHWVNAGIFLCEPRLLQFIPPGQACDFGHDVIPMMLSLGESLYGYTLGTGETLHWIDTPEDLKRTNIAILQEGSISGP
jgi:mannose-1-phosphate guanylyltransferase